MFNQPKSRCIFFIFIITRGIGAGYTPPSGLVEPYKPAGFRISIPHEDGISLVAFHININEEFEGIEAGAIAVDIHEHKNGRWTYQNKITNLNKGDTLHYWVHVVYNGLGYNLLDQKHKVTDFYNYNGTKIEPPMVQAFKPAGLRISLPHTEGISLVAFHIKINEEFEGIEAGRINKDIREPKNGLWTYEDITTELHENDMIHYWLYIVFNGIGRNLLDQEHRVTQFYDYNGTKTEPVLVQPLAPAGIRISVAHTQGVSLVAFHININQDFEGLEAGKIAVDIRRPKNGRWTYEDKTTELQKGDIVYYWVHYIYNGLGYNLVEQKHIVTDYFP